jgi:hypothetical protein
VGGAAGGGKGQASKRSSYWEALSSGLEPGDDEAGGDSGAGA